jgi:hypothetical protein
MSSTRLSKASEAAKAIEAAETRRLKVKLDLVLVEVWARNSLYQFAPFIPNESSLDYNGAFYSVFIIEYGREIAGMLSDRVPTEKKTLENPKPQSERAEYLQELWSASIPRIRNALTQKRTAVMSAMKKSYLGNYIEHKVNGVPSATRVANN